MDEQNEEGKKADGEEKNGDKMKDEKKD